MSGYQVDAGIAGLAQFSGFCKYAVEEELLGHPRLLKVGSAGGS
jgi:hypothetical protein